MNIKTQEYLENFENDPFCQINEPTVSKKIEGLSDDPVLVNEALYEQVAFSFTPDYDPNRGWGKYYGPLFVLPNSDGVMVEFPSISKLEPEIIEYWKKRADISFHPILKLRYADLVLEFSSEICGDNPGLKMHHIAIDSTLQAVSKNLQHPIYLKTKLKRALSLGVRINDKKRIKELVDSIVEFEDRVAVDDKPGLWGFSFQWLLLDRRRKIELTEDQEQEIVRKIEMRFTRIKSNIHLLEHSVKLLCEYYAKRNNEEEIKRILQTNEEARKNDKRSNTEPLLQTANYEKILTLYQRYANRFPFAVKAVRRVRLELQQLDIDWHKSMKKISVETSIKQDDIESFLESMFEAASDNIELSVTRLVAFSIPDWGKTEQLYEEVRRDHPFQYLVTRKIFSNDGATVATLNSNDRERHLSHFSGQQLVYGSLLLGFSIERFKKLFSLEAFLDYLKRSDLLEKQNWEFLEKAVTYFWNEEFVESSHLLIPIIENTVRTFIKMAGRSIMTPNTDGGYDYLPLTTLLKNNAAVFEETYVDNGSDIHRYFSIALTNKLGLNLRNDFAHGINTEKYGKKNVSDTLIHILLCLSLIKAVKS